MATNRLPDPVAVLDAVGEQTFRFFRKAADTVLDMLAAVGGVFAMCGRIVWLFPQALKDPDAVMKQANFKRATDDRFFIVIEACDSRYDAAGTRALLEKIGGKDVAELEP